jgi:hypothetical protein
MFIKQLIKGFQLINKKMKELIFKMIILAGLITFILIPFSIFSQNSVSANTGSNKTICQGDKTTIGSAAVQGHSYLWSPSTGLSSTTSAQPFASPSVTTTYYLTETDTATNIKLTGSVVVKVNPLPAANTGGDITICSADGVKIGDLGIEGHTYSWTPISGLSFYNTAQPTAHPRQTGTYKLTETITATGCTNSASMVITVNSRPEAYTGPDKTLCSGRLTEIGGEPVAGNLYLWTPETGLSIPDISQPAVSASKTTTYTLTEINPSTGCKNSNSVKITVLEKPSIPVDPTGDSKLCQFKNINQYTTNVISNATAYKWSVSPSNAATINGTDNHVTALWSENFTGIANISVSASNTCGSSVSSNPITIMVNPVPSTPAITLKNGILVSSSESGNQWYDSIGAITGATQQYYKPLFKGDYFVVINNNGCNSVPSNHISYFINGSTPTYVSGSKENNLFQIYPNPNNGNFTIELPDIKDEVFGINIYNSFGKKVFQINQPNTKTGNQIPISLDNLEPGLYIISIKSENIDLSSKFMVN